MSKSKYPVLLSLVLAALSPSVVLAQSQPLQLSPAKAASAKAPQSAARNDEAPSLERINGYFNTMRGLQADFVQVSPDGRRFGGILYLLRPGRMRFEYAKPATLEVVADGRSVAIRDRKLNTQDVYFIGQTPLKFLLQPKIDVAKDSKIIGLKREGDAIVLMLEDKSTFGGTSRIRVVFDGSDYALREWSVTDPQGSDTRVVLSNLNLAALPDKSLFVIDEQRLVQPK